MMMTSKAVRFFAISCALLLRRQYTGIRSFAVFDIDITSMQFDYAPQLTTLIGRVSHNAIAEDKPEPFSFSACLLAKDVNIILPEWLAYHYTVLPLRRLIVAIDPMTETDPTPILDLYQSLGMNITVWINHTDSYWIDGKEYYMKSDYVITNETSFKQIMARHNHRQNVFYKGCLRQLQEEGRSWTALVDTDEYIAFNHYDERENKQPNENNKRSRLKEFGTVAEYIASGVDDMFSNSSKAPCVVLSRPLFVSKESDISIIERSVPDGIDPTYFHTLRYRYRQSLQERQNGKSLVDASRYDGRNVLNAHRPLGDLCTGNRPDSSRMGLRVHHYVGSWEAFRRPGLDNRGVGTFQDRNSPKQQANDEDDTLRPWLSRFVELVGKETAFTVTQDARGKAERHVRSIIDLQAQGDRSNDWSHLDYDWGHPFQQQKTEANVGTFSPHFTGNTGIVTNLKIPHSLVFIHTNMTSLGNLPKGFEDNVHNTIDMFRAAWQQDNEVEAPVYFLNDTSCRDAIENAEPKLLKYYGSASLLGMFKADICRVAYLYLFGGYYFDVDMKTVKALQLSNEVTFASAISDNKQGRSDYMKGGFFQSILASAPKHPILEKALEAMLGHFNGTLSICQGQLLGPCTLHWAYDNVPEQAKASARLLRESNLDNQVLRDSYPNVSRQHGWGCCCNYVVQDDALREIYFFSRIVGAGPSCRFRGGSIIV